VNAARRRSTRPLEVVLLAAMAVGSLALWIAVPAGWIWLAAQLNDDYSFVYGVALVGCPLTMGAFAYGLAKLNGLYLRLTDAGETGPPRAAWLKSMRAERGSSRARTPLDLFMTASVMIAIAVLMAFFFFGGGSPISPYN